MINLHLHQRRIVHGSIMVWLLMLLSVAGAQPVAAQDEPPPRPTLEPTVTPTTLPPTAQAPDEPDDPTPEPRGRIIGTVIDLTTGAPAPNIAVVVGDTVIRTDSNGNYERGGLPPGAYTVEIQLAAEQGTPAQAPLTVVLAGDEVVVQHLAFYSVVQPTQAPATPVAPPPASPTATSVALPTQVPATPVAPPATLPTATFGATILPTDQPTLPPPTPTSSGSDVAQTLPGAGAASAPHGWLIVIGSVLVALGAWQLQKQRHPKW